MKIICPICSVENRYCEWKEVIYEDVFFDEAPLTIDGLREGRKEILESLYECPSCKGHLLGAELNIQEEKDLLSRKETELVA